MGDEELNQQCEECEDDVDLSTIMPFIMPGMMGGRDVLAENGVVFLSGAVTEKSAENIMRRLWAYNFDDDYVDSINLIINSPGGRADCMWALIDTMSAIKNEIQTVAIGDVGSAAFMIFIAGDIRIMSENAVAMIHHYFGGAAGNHADLIAARKGQDLEYKRCIQHLVRHSKYNTEKQIKEHLLKDQDNWLSPQEMQAAGLVDEIFFNRPRRKKKK